jgi:hypothetical protein
MRNLRKVQLAGVGMTLALMGHPQTAAARSVDVTNGVQMDAARTSAAVPAEAKNLLYREVFTLSTAEKLRIGGDRIRLSQAQSGSPDAAKPGKSKVKTKKDVHKRAKSGSDCEAATSTNPIRCLRAKEKTPSQAK